MRKTLTEKTVSRLKAPATGRLEVFDTITPGFGLRITPSNSRTYFALYRIKGDRKQHRLTLGDAAEKSLSDARNAAKDALAMALDGKDPKLHRDAVVEANKAKDAQLAQDRFEAVARSYVTRYAKAKLRQWRAVELMIEKRLVKEWGARPIQSITRRDLIALLDVVGDKTPIMANRLQALLSKLFGWCVERGILEQSPAVGVKKPHKERSRDRVLSDDEIKAVWLAADAIGYPGGALVKLLLLTACRLNEIAQLTRPQIDGDLIVLPKTKNGRPHVVPITRQIDLVLKSLPTFKGEGDFLLTSTAGKRPMQNFADVKAKLDSLSGVSGWTFHDLRRTAASRMAKLGVMPHIIEVVLNHSSGALSGVAAVYNRYDYANEKREALKLWESEILRIIKGKVRFKVVGGRR